MRTFNQITIPTKTRQKPCVKCRQLSAMRDEALAEVKRLTERVAGLKMELEKAEYAIGQYSDLVQYLQPQNQTSDDIPF